MAKRVWTRKKTKAGLMSGASLRAYMEHHRYPTIKDLAFTLDVSRDTITAYMTEKKPIPHVVALALSALAMRIPPQT